ncbi:MATE family efflux transporter [Entomospira nematocerorum]|uniref:MATE family efflux transporter n=1 Tax=Entomospira nematocerorum TaxID=2719987 RepID=A0A968KU94_9SPIO|nr:MATE family efflux transporter [Entomospira nematocera]NIZ47029.1 MATE family efflux transporter [Entomospira nematocera]WDI34426.1 MATE family efflux transporter [Entomospira nematocera]
MKGFFPKRATKRSCLDTEEKLDCQRTSYFRLISLAIPLVVQGFIFILALLVDRLLIAHYDLIQFAAVGIAGWTATAIFFFFHGTVNFAGNMVAQYFGANRREFLIDPVWVALVLAGIFSVVLIATIPWSKQIFGIPLFNMESSMRKYSEIYFSLLMLAHAISLFSTAVMVFFAGIGHTVKLMMIAIVGNVVNMGFGWLLIFGHWGFPELGITGAGLASVISSAVSLAFALSLFFLAAKSYPAILKPRIKWRQMGRLIKMGSPAGLEMGLEMSGFAILKLALGSISAEAVAAAGISFSLLEFVDAPLDALAAATAIMIAQERGALRYHNLGIIIRRALIIAISYSIVMMLVLGLYPAQLIGLFSGGDDVGSYEALQEIYRIAGVYIWLTMIWLVPNAYLTIYSRGLKALGDSRYLAVWIIFLTFTIIIGPSLWLMQQPWWWTTYAIYGVTIPYVLVLSYILRKRYLSGIWRDVHMVD